MSNKLLLGIVVLALLAGGCQKKEAEKAVEPEAKVEAAGESTTPAAGLALSASLLDKISVRIEKAAESPRFNKAIEELVDQAAAHPSLATAGEAFFSRLGNDPALAGPANAFVTKLTTSKVMQQFVLKTMSENPGLNPEQLGEVVGKKVDKILSGPAWDQGIDQALDRLMKLPQVNTSFDRLADKLVTGVQFEKRLSEVLDPLLGNAQVAAELTRLNDGKPVSGADDVQKLADKVFTEARLLDLLVGFCGMKTLSDGLGVELGKLVNSPGFAKGMAPNLARIIADPKVEAKALELFDILLGGKVDASKLANNLQAVFDQPIVAKELVTIIGSLSTNQKFIEDVRSAFLVAIKSPEFVTVLVGSLKS